MINQTGKFVHELSIPVRWYDMDAFGHVNNSIYFTYFEQTRISWWMEVAPPSYSLDKMGPVVVTANCSYIKPIVYPEIILSKLYVGPPSRSSYDCFCKMYSEKNPDILYAEAYAKIVWVDREAGRSTPIPDELRHLLPEK